MQAISNTCTEKQLRQRSIDMQDNVAYLSDKANQLRISIIEMLHKSGSGHPGGSLSICDILSVLYYHEMNIDSQDPNDPDRDRMILSKGHACPALYAVLADKAFFPKDHLATLRQFGSILQGHPDMKKVPGVEISSGSLGMGISFGIGTAIGAKLNKKSYRTYVLTGCGELDEGQNWEAFMCAPKFKCDNLLVIVDFNKVQLDGTNQEIMPLGDLASKIRSFGWNVIECNGHSVEQLLESFATARTVKGVPTAIIADTIKGKGVSFMEGKSSWHGKTIDDESYKKSMMELVGEK